MPQNKIPGFITKEELKKFLTSLRPEDLKNLGDRDLSQLMTVIDLRTRIGKSIEQEVGIRLRGEGTKGVLSELGALLIKNRPTL